MNKKTVLLLPAFVIGSLSNILAIPRGYNHPSRADTKCARRVAIKQTDFTSRPHEFTLGNNAISTKGLAILLIAGLATSAIIPGAIAGDVDTGCPCSSSKDCNTSKCPMIANCPKSMYSWYCRGNTNKPTCMCHPL